MKLISLAVLCLGATLLAAQEKDLDAVAAAVTQALKGTKEINAKDISVTTHASTVVLSGTVATEPEAARALTVAEKAAAGTRVTSNLEVEPPAEGTADAAAAQLVRDVQAALHKDPRTANLPITVTIDEQKGILLQGLVPARQDRTTAQTVASQVKGVTKIDNRLQTPGQ
jgi:osmotically-inducible protein OsmY